MAPWLGVEFIRADPSERVEIVEAPLGRGACGNRGDDEGGSFESTRGAPGISVGNGGEGVGSAGKGGEG
jgi:hypothetical protein